jgi:hypothetical protein
LTLLETWCASAVERAFAAAFPTPLEPVGIARKIISAFESASVPSGCLASRVVACVSPQDRLRLDGECAALERQWQEMLAGIAASAKRADRPKVSLEAKVGQPRGTAFVVVEFSNEGAAPARSSCAPAIRIVGGQGDTYPISHPLIVGRDKECDLVVADTHVSRRHLRVYPEGDEIIFADLASSNGVFLNGVKRASGSLRVGDTLRLGNTELHVVAGERGL